jgi:peptide/nickel transport system substrate-binding protein
MMRALVIVVLAALAAIPAAAQQRQRLVETPMLAAAVDAGRLPRIRERIPEQPLITQFSVPGSLIGQHGGDLHMLMGRPQDVRMLVVYGYARLVGYDANFDIVPDLLEAVDNDHDRVFTFHLRRGHRWSDGAPFTAEDFRYWWDDVANDKDLSPLGIPKTLLVDGKPPRFEVLDQTTVRFTWAAPNPYFLPALAGASPLYLFRPAHYLKQFHKYYADPAKLQDLVRQAGARNWAQLHNRMDNQYRNDNPDLPTLEPWVAQTRPPSDRFVFVRNPYYHRIDADGRQLPYIDRVIVNIVDGRILPAKTGAGESDLQARGLNFNNYTFLRQAAKRNDFHVDLWRTARGAQLALYPNLNARDPAWRQLNRDVRFRRALSLAINRHEINQVAYFGLAIEGGNTVLPDSPLYRPEDRTAWSSFNLAEANRLLDEIGLTKRNSEGLRLLPDGRPMEIIIETAGEDTEQSDVLELIHDTWLQAGIKLFIKPSQREVFRNRIFSGEAVMSIWPGLENGLVTANMPPDEFAPLSQQQLQWPKWGEYVETNGVSGERCDDPVAQQLLRLHTGWRNAESFDARRKIWQRMIDLNAQQVYSIGLIAGVRQPVVVSNRLRNVPADGIYNFDPGAFFGIYRMDSFWFQKSGETAEAPQ